jgi:hypothetical protein
MDADGDILIAWQSDGQDLDDFNILSSRFGVGSPAIPTTSLGFDRLGRDADELDNLIDGTPA